jgi:glutamate racemase
VPYGTKGAETVRRFSIEALRLLEARGVKRVIVACNTASALGLSAMRNLARVPVEGVIEPGIEAALLRTRGRVGVIGTLGTIGSNAYQSGLLERAADLTVHGIACPLFVPLAEEGWTQGDIPRSIARRYLQPLIDARVDTVILGCTHYPLLKGTIAEVMGPKVQLVDSAVVLAEALASELRDLDALAPDSATPRLSILVSDVPQRFADLGARFLERDLPEVELVDLESPVVHGSE